MMLEYGFMMTNSPCNLSVVIDIEKMSLYRNEKKNTPPSIRHNIQRVSARKNLQTSTKIIIERDMYT